MFSQTPQENPEDSKWKYLAFICYAELNEDLRGARVEGYKTSVSVSNPIAETRGTTTGRSKRRKYIPR